MIDYKTKSIEVVTRIAQETRGESEATITRILTEQMPFNRNNLAAWKAYWQVVYDLTNRQMGGHQYKPVKRLKR